jgi:hypothetical protein
VERRVQRCGTPMNAGRSIRRFVPTEYEYIGNSVKHNNVRTRR